MDDVKKKNPGAVAMAKARAASMTPERRKEIAQKAVATRWKNAKKRTAQEKKAAKSRD